MLCGDKATKVVMLRIGLDHDIQKVGEYNVEGK